MTICIAVLCESRKGLITISDHRFSIGNISADVFLKSDPIGGDWIGMYAGEVSPTTPLIEDIRTELQKVGTRDYLDSVAEVCVKSYRRVLAKEAEAHILSPFNLTMEEFLEHGQTMFSPNDHSQLVVEIRNHHLTRSFCELLIAGFDKNGVGHIFTIKKPGIIEYSDQIGFAAIGSGSLSSLEHLYFHEYSWTYSLHEAMYLACSAKFMAERASDVGKDFMAIYTRPQGYSSFFKDDEIEEIRALWNKEGRARLPDDLENRLKKIISSPLPTVREPPS